jgi:hypothetical protein
VLLEHRPSSHLFGSVTVAPRPFGAFLDVLVLAFSLRAYAAQGFFAGIGSSSGLPPSGYANQETGNPL